MPEIPEYPAITDVEPGDLLVVVDVSDTSESPEGTTKRITLSQLPGGGSGTVTEVSGSPGNGFTVGVTSETTTPVIEVGTSVTGLLMGDGTAVSAAAAGTDYAPATSGSAILKGSGSGGFSAAAAGTDYLAPAGNGSQLTGIIASQVGADPSGAASAAQAAAQSYALAQAQAAAAASDPSGSASSALTAAESYADASKLAKSANLSDLGNAGTARTNLGLGSAAVQNTSAFDAAGAAAASAAYFLRVFAA